MAKNRDIQGNRGRKKEKASVIIKKRDDFPERGVGSKGDYEKNNEGFRM